MKLPARSLATVFAGALLSTSSWSRETVMVIGDSLSREYQFEFSNFPEARNWVELLAVHRPDDFHFGPLESTDLGLLADTCGLVSLGICDAIGEDGELDRYRYNWAIPTYSAEGYADDLSGSSFVEGLFQDFVDDDFNDVDSVVVFLGGNDIDRVYSSVYNGNTSTTNRIIRDITDDLESIVDFVLADTPDMRMILVNVPHVGATPEVKGSHPTDPVRTGRVTTALLSLDSELRNLAARKNIGYADILPLTIELLSEEPYLIAGVPFLNRGSDTGAVDHMWLGGEISQNFHPNTVGQAVVANAIVAAYNEKYALGATPFSDTEIVEDLLGLETPLTAWARAAGLPADQRQPEDDAEGDRLNNLIEFALDLDPNLPSRLPTPRQDSGELIYEFRLNPDALDMITVTPERSSDLSTWSPVGEGAISSLPGNRIQVRLSQSPIPEFLRLRVQQR